MKRIRKAAKATSVIIIAILTALTLTILCASEEERIEIAETVDNLSDQEEPERQIDWEMGIVGMASSRRREEAVKSWRRSPGAAERENGGFFVTLGLSNAERSAANEAMIAEIPKVAFF